MKNIFLFLLTVVLVYSCRPKDDYSPTEEELYGIKVERNTTFSPLPIGYTNTFKFNLVTNYNFDDPNFQTVFYFHPNTFNGVLKLNGVVLNPNTMYYFINKNNIFEYTGNSIGDHILKFDVLNPRYSKEETFTFKYY